MKRLRFEIQPNKIRFYHCGEYGENYGRPHYHSLIFGYDFPDKRPWSQSTGKNFLYRSEQLERLWPSGFSTVGNITSESAAYCARYTIKKLNGPARDVINPETGLKPYEKIDDYGEIQQIIPEYATMSRHPGIGRDWYETFKTDVFPDDFVVVKGKKLPTPAYYRRLLASQDPDLAEQLKEKRVQKAATKRHDQTPERLLVREKIQIARASRLIRTYENGT